jgi:hypothetical protein
VEKSETATSSRYTIVQYPNHHDVRGAGWSEEKNLSFIKE